MEKNWHRIRGSRWTGVPRTGIWELVERLPYSYGVGIDIERVLLPVRSTYTFFRIFHSDRFIFLFYVIIYTSSFVRRKEEAYFYDGDDFYLLLWM